MFITNSAENALAKMASDFRKNILPKFFQDAKQGDILIITTHLVNDNLLKKFPCHSIEELNPPPFLSKALAIFTVKLANTFKNIHPKYKGKTKVNIEDLKKKKWYRLTYKK